MKSGGITARLILILLIGMWCITTLSVSGTTEHWLGLRGMTARYEQSQWQ